jgi:hypothetical protein
VWNDETLNCCKAAIGGNADSDELVAGTLLLLAKNLGLLCWPRGVPLLLLASHIDVL